MVGMIDRAGEPGSSKAVVKATFDGGVLIAPNETNSPPQGIEQGSFPTEPPTNLLRQIN
jgi:hypothetical protein